MHKIIQKRRLQYNSNNVQSFLAEELISIASRIPANPLLSLMSGITFTCSSADTHSAARDKVTGSRVAGGRGPGGKHQMVFDCNIYLRTTSLTSSVGT